MSSLPLGILSFAVFCGVLAIALMIGRSERTSAPGVRVQDYVSAASEVSQVQIESSKQRPPRSPLERALAHAAVLSPGKLRASAASDIARARAPINPSVFLGIRAVLMIGLPAFGLIWVVLSPQKGPLQWLFFGMLLIAGPKLPTMWLQRRIKRNEKTIQRALPFAVDLLVACLEGGLSLEAALDKVASETDSLLSEEIQQTLAEIALGRPSVEALRDLGTRTGIADLKRLTETVLQAERMGVSIAEAMRTLADESRTRRRQRAEEEARKAPIKMLPVMVCTTLPAIGAVVMTPALINFTRALSVFVHK